MGAFDRPDALVSFEELHEVLGMAAVEDLEGHSLAPAQRDAEYGAGDAALLPGAALVAHLGD